MFEKSPVILPLLAMMALTALVWLWMYVRRLSYLFGNKIDAQAVSTPDKLKAIIPESIQFPANNLQNLFEVPVIFYALGLLSILVNFAPHWFVTCAWVYVAFRVLHSLVQCTINNVNLRFVTYSISCWTLWAMLAGLACHVLCGV